MPCGVFCIGCEMGFLKTVFSCDEILFCFSELIQQPVGFLLPELCLFCLCTCEILLQMQITQFLSILFCNIVIIIDLLMSVLYSCFKILKTFLQGPTFYRATLENRPIKTLSASHMAWRVLNSYIVWNAVIMLAFQSVVNENHLLLIQDENDPEGQYTLGMGR